MDLENFELGDIVSIISHPYQLKTTDILISGEPLQLPPLMILIEISESVKKDLDKVSSNIYTCLWFSSKSNKFERTKIKSPFLKLISRNENILKSVDIGCLLSLSSLEYELSKKKSSLHFEDTSISNGTGSSTINALLSFLPPVLHCIGIKEKKGSKVVGDTKLANKVSECEVKCMWFNNTLERFSEESLPIEALGLIPIIDLGILNLVHLCIKDLKTLTIEKDGLTFLIKPRSMSYRSGYYFIRGYDFILNKITETSINNSDSFKIIATPFIEVAPKFNIEQNPESGTAKYIVNELKTAIESAAKRKSFIRIKYKNRNDQISIRTLKDLRIIEGTEDNSRVLYLIAFCMLRQAERSFKINRIQNFQELSIKYE